MTRSGGNKSYGISHIKRGHAAGADNLIRNMGVLQWK
jgi:hypothetical protein